MLIDKRHELGLFNLAQDDVSKRMLKIFRGGERRGGGWGGGSYERPA